MLRAFFSRLRASLTTVLMSGAALCASAAEVTVGYVDLMEPGFFSQTVMSALTAVAQERKDDRVHSLRLSPMIALQEIRQRRPDIVISPAESLDRWVPSVAGKGVAIGGPNNDGTAMMISVRDVGVPLSHMQYIASYPCGIVVNGRNGPYCRWWFITEKIRGSP